MRPARHAHHYTTPYTAQIIDNTNRDDFVRSLVLVRSCEECGKEDHYNSVTKKWVVFKPARLQCQDCKKFKDDVEDGFCPYQAEINDEQVPVTLCGDCYSDRAQEI